MIKCALKSYHNEKICKQHIEKRLKMVRTSIDPTMRDLDKAEKHRKKVRRKFTKMSKIENDSQLLQKRPEAKF